MTADAPETWHHDLADALDQIENALAAPSDERTYFARQARNVLPEGHPAREVIEAGLEGDEFLSTALRTAYGYLPPGRDRDADHQCAKTQDSDTVAQGRPDGSAEEDRRETVTLELPTPLLDRIALETDAGESVEDWIRRAAWLRLLELKDDHRVTVRPEIELPEGVWERAKLDAAIRRAKGGDARPTEYLWEYLNEQPRLTVEGRTVLDCGDESRHEPGCEGEAWSADP